MLNQQNPGAQPARVTQRPVIESIAALHTDISGISASFPPGLELRFSKPVVLLYGENGAGKTGFMRMLCESLRNARYYATHQRSWFTAEIEQNHALWSGLTSGRPFSSNLIRSFAYEHRDDFAFQRCLKAALPSKSARSRWRSVRHRHSKFRPGLIGNQKCLSTLPSEFQHRRRICQYVRQ